MDDKTKDLINRWLGKALNGWKLTDYVNSGKSALVFKGVRNGEFAAVKVFDPEIIKKFGRAEEDERIQRELSLVGKQHPNLVRILDGGFSDELGLFFIAMEFIDAPNLGMVLKNVPADRIPAIISQVANAAEFLEGVNISHRDIKPDNIAVLPDFTRAILLDLGVIRPIDAAGPLTDREKQVFIGTLQYASPEFLLREEEQTKAGFRAVTFYQLGAVLHDLLMQERLFQEYTYPYAKLVQAVLHTKPVLDGTGKPPQLVRLAKNCLVKDPNLRLQIVSWSDFHPARPDVDPIASAKEQIRRLRAQASYESAESGDVSGWQQLVRRQQHVGQLLSRMSEQLRAEAADGDLPALIVHQITGNDGAVGQLKGFFPPSRSAGLLLPITLALKVAILDYEAEVVRIDMAMACNNCEMSIESFDSRWLTILSGVYDDTAVRGAIAKFLYPAMAKAMEQSASSGLPYWLTEGGTDTKAL